MRYSQVLVLTFLLVLISPVSAFDLQQVYIQIHAGQFLYDGENNQESRFREYTSTM